MALIGYARVSTQDQNMDMQKDALEREGCIRIFEDYISGAKAEREGLNAALDYLREGDTLVMWKLDRLGRSMKHLVNIVTTLKEKGVSFKSLQEHIDTTSAAGNLIFHIFASLAEFERSLISERTIAGLKSARARGRKGGRKALLGTDDIILLKNLHGENKISIDKLAEMFGIKRPTLFKYLKKESLQIIENSY